LQMPKNPKEMPFLAHLEELRWRIIKSLISILLFSVIAYLFSEKILDFLTKSVNNIYFTAPTEAFAVRIKISLIAGLILSFPVVFYQLWQFVVPGLMDKEAKMVIPDVISQLMLAAPLYFLYEVSIILVRVTNKNK